MDAVARAAVGRLGGPVPEAGRGCGAAPSVVQPAASLPSARRGGAGGAHVQRTPGAGGGHEVARLLCLRRLVGDLDGDGRDDRLATYVALRRAGVRALDGLPRCGTAQAPAYVCQILPPAGRPAPGMAETFASLAQALHQAD